MLKPKWTGTEWIETEVIEPPEENIELNTSEKIAQLQEKISVLQSQIPELEAQICELILLDMTESEGVIG